jgi:hypothetical protein
MGFPILSDTPDSVNTGPQVLNRPVWIPRSGKSQTIGLDFSRREPAIGLIQMVDHVKWGDLHETWSVMSDDSEKGGFYGKQNLTLEGVRDLGVELKCGKIFVILTIDLLTQDSGDASGVYW